MQSVPIGQTHMSKKRLGQLFEHELIRVGDTVQFEFKGNTFVATFSEGGVLHKCSWGNNKHAQTQIFKNRTFITLSDWTESCIQEILQEFHTRYSSWKRVLHLKSKRTLDEIWKNYMQNRLEKIKKPTVEQMRQMNERLLEKLAQAKEKIEDLSSRENTRGIHPIIMDSPHGTYMVLQRMKETDNPNLSAIQGMGIDEFRKHLTTFTKEKVIECGDTTPHWFEEKRKTTDNHEIATYVYNFFTSNKRKAEDEHIEEEENTKKSKT